MAQYFDALIAMCKHSIEIFIFVKLMLKSKIWCVRLCVVWCGCVCVCTCVLVISDMSHNAGTLYCNFVIKNHKHRKDEFNL